MSNSDTVKLLRECNSGIQMAVFSIDEILEKETAQRAEVTQMKEEFR